MLMLAIGVIKRPSFALRAAMAIMPTLAQRSIFYGVRTCALKPVEGHRASGPLKQEPSEEQLEAVLRNLRPSGWRGCQQTSVGRLFWSRSFHRDFRRRGLDLTVVVGPTELQGPALRRHRKEGDEWICRDGLMQVGAQDVSAVVCANDQINDVT